jgi:hypothetical protein
MPKRQRKRPLLQRADTVEPAVARLNQHNRHKADMLNALTNVRFWGKANVDQPLLTNLDYEYSA